MQDSWGNGGEEMSMSTSQWDAEDGDMWNSPTSQESSNSWGNGPKKGPSKVRKLLLSIKKKKKQAEKLLTSLKKIIF